MRKAILLIVALSLAVYALSPAVAHAILPPIPPEPKPFGAKYIATVEYLALIKDVGKVRVLDYEFNGMYVDPLMILSSTSSVDKSMLVKVIITPDTKIVGSLEKGYIAKINGKLYMVFTVNYVCYDNECIFNMKKDYVVYADSIVATPNRVVYPLQPISTQ